MTASLLLDGWKYKLYQGGFRDVWPKGYRDYDCVVLTALEFQPEPQDILRMEPTEILAHPFDDVPLTRKHLRDAIDLANQVARRVRQGKSVLVTCAAGLNRSGLVNALAIHQLTGMAGPDIVQRIRARRHPMALSNESFAKAVSMIQRSKRYPHTELGNYVSV